MGTKELAYQQHVDQFARSLHNTFMVFLMREMHREGVPALQPPVEPRRVFGYCTEIDEGGLEFWRRVATAASLMTIEPLEKLAPERQRERIDVLLDLFAANMYDPKVLSMYVAFQVEQRVRHDRFGLGTVKGYTAKHYVYEDQKSATITYSVKFDDEIVGIERVHDWELKEAAAGE